MSTLSQKKLARLKRQVRVRKKVRGASERPRLNVFKSAKHIYAQLIDDTTGSTLAAASTLDAEVAGGLKYTGNAEAAVKVGATIAAVAVAKGIKSVEFDRNGFLYDGGVQAIAEPALETGLLF